MTDERRPAPQAPDFALQGEVLEALSPEELQEAARFLEQIGQAIFPSGPAGKDELTWAEREAESEVSGRSLEERLRHAEARFRTLIEQIPAVTFMAVLGEGENEVYVSPHIEQMLGYTQEEWLSDPFLWYWRLHVDDRKLWNEEFARGCQTGGPFRAECRFLARDGSIVWVHGEARVVRDERGRPQFLQGVAFDITESKRAQEVVLQNAVRSARLEEELQIARRLQTSILPATPSLEGLEIAAAMVPAEKVGGDYYDVRPTGDGGWLAIGDVSGHGLNAGLVMLLVQSAAAGLSRAKPDATPADVVTMLNEVLFDSLARRLGQEHYVTLSVLRYFRDGRVVFAGAHEHVLICRAGTGAVESILTPGTWIGIRSDIGTATRDQELQLRPGDLMVLYTDGVIEAMNAEGVQYEMRRLTSALARLHDKPVTEIRDGILEAVRAWTHVQEDDVTLLVSRYHGP